ncbi:helix-turn-helix transcriptional regulator [Haloechinothrix salitolerans]|uniref:Helix-turn-helix domain-containing protein n=1 Tax=Haloechinothrix salitolerans TaxID=926830 RepID=A0ABW2C7Q4_9PSEU
MATATATKKLTDQTDEATEAIKRASGKQSASKSRAGTRRTTGASNAATAKKSAARKTQAHAKRDTKDQAKAQPEAQAQAEGQTVESASTPRYAPEDVTQRLGAAIAALRGEGWSRPNLAEVFQMTQSALWRVENGRTRTDEVDVVQTGLDKIEKGEVTKPERKTGGRPAGPSNADLLAKITELESKVDALTELVKALNK